MAAELDLASVASESRAFAERLAKGRFYVACVGQFKRGKSSLLNALIGEALLPTGVAPVTAVITILRFGETREAFVHTLDGHIEAVAASTLAAYVTERDNPGNRRGVTVVEVTLPHPLLKLGMCLVDTPGLGSVFAESTAATETFVPHTDAALVVLGADPPVSQDELQLIERLATQTDELLLVLNKADRLPDGDRLEARRFSEGIIGRHLGRPARPLLEVSATERLSGTGPARDWELLTRKLATLAERSGAALLEAAERRGVELFGSRLLHAIDEREAALVRPAKEAVARIASLKRSSEAVDQWIRELGHILSAEQERLHGVFGARQDAFLARALPHVREELRAALGMQTGTRRTRWKAANRLAQELFRRVLEEWRSEERPAAEALYREAASRFTELANDFLTRIRADAGDLAPLEVPPLLTADAGFRTKSRLYFTELLTITSRSPPRWLVDTLRMPRSYDRSVERHAVAYLAHLVQTNAMRVTNDLDELVLESRRQLEHDVRERLRDTYRVAEEALARARAQRAQGEAAVAGELRRIRDARAIAKRLLATDSDAR